MTSGQFPEVHCYWLREQRDYPVVQAGGDAATLVAPIYELAGAQPEPERRYVIISLELFEEWVEEMNRLRAGRPALPWEGIPGVGQGFEHAVAPEPLDPRPESGRPDRATPAE